MQDYSVEQNLLSLSIFLFGWMVVFLIAHKNYREIVFTAFLYIWHTIFCIYYYLFSLENVADSITYYRKIILDEGGFYPGTPFVTFLGSIIYKPLAASYLNIFLFYNIAGAVALVLLYLILKDYIKNRIWLLIFFLPSMSFWTSALGKDSISFLAVCIFLYALVNNQKKYILLPLSFIFMVRPHIALCMIVAYGVFLLFKSRVHFILKLLLIPVLFGSMFVASGFVKDYVGLEEGSYDDVSAYVGQRQELNLSGGSSIDIASMSYPMQMFTYVFRPLPYESHSLLAFINSLENSLFLFLFLFLLYKSKINLKFLFDNNNLLLLIYTLLVWSILAMTTANLGIASRQKWMFMPILIYFLIYGMAKVNESSSTMSRK
ncbi:hypothetical protein F940_01558 [Acinetobacter radioresistens NIPH 2130]|uniref:hypothetical protein n=1 Tax=Acinetobacter radioresistens TaxID=40216 RepID=UPI0002CE48D1|nr:hypothetical protein [Acinetobacter radioresistens]ENV86245.1 hypothetical protein F940_01558 [Acinetobacter radioresistens NIPH 2130]